MHVISLAALTVLDAGPVGQIRAAAAAGFDAVGLRLNPLVPSDATIVGNRRAEAEVIRQLSGTGLSVLEIGVFPLRPDTDPDRLEPIISFSASIGAKYLVCPVEDAEEGRRVQTFVQICELAKRFGVTALIEFNPYSACCDLETALKLISSAGQANGALCVDALHLSRSGGHPRDLRDVQPSLLPIVHFCDASPPPVDRLSTDLLRAESRTARLLPGEGALWLTELLGALPEDVAISIEAPSARNAHLSAEERARLALGATRRVLMAGPS
jgi:sugar phosphate isomerase/epimerase